MTSMTHWEEEQRRQRNFEIIEEMLREHKELKKASEVAQMEKPKEEELNPNIIGCCWFSGRSTVCVVIVYSPHEDSGEVDENGNLLHGLGNGGNVPGSGGSSGGSSDDDTSATIIPNKVISKIFTHTKDEETGKWEDLTTTFNYENKQLKSISTSDGETITIQYNADQKISKMESSGFTAIYTYNANKQATKLSIDAGGLSTINTDFSYDASGKVNKMVNLTSVSFPLSMSIKRNDVLTYSSTQVAKCVSTYAVTPADMGSYANVNSTYTYDNNGNLLTETTPLNETTSYDYDALNRVLQAQAVLDNTPVTTKYGYNAQGVNVPAGNVARSTSMATTRKG